MALIFDIHGPCSQSDAFVGIDSYFLHVADFAGLRTVGIVRSISTKHWGVDLREASMSNVSRPAQSWSRTY
jgi:hypothetical protein